MRASAFLVAFLVIALAAAPLASAGPGKSAAARAASKAADDAFEANPNREAALAKAESRGLFGKWQRDGTHVHGRFAGFDLTGVEGKIANYGYRNGTSGLRTIFSEVLFEDFTRDASGPGANGVRLTGSVLRIYGTDGVVGFHNNPTAGIRFHNGDHTRSITFLLAPGNTVGNLSDNNRSVTINLAGFSHTTHGHIAVTNGTIEKTATTVKVILGPDSNLGFIVHPKGFKASLLHSMVSAIAKGKLGASGAVVIVAGKPVIQSDDVDVSLTASHATAKRFVFNASGSGIGSRVVAVTLDRADFPDLKNGSVEVKVAGVKVNLVSDVNVLDATGGAANVTIEKDIILVTVHVAHFSTQEIVVQSAETSGGSSIAPPPSSGIPGFEALLVLAALLGVAAASRLRRR